MDEESIGGVLKFQNRMDAITQKIDVDMIKALLSIDDELKELVEFVIKYGILAYLNLSKMLLLRLPLLIPFRRNFVSLRG